MDFQDFVSVNCVIFGYDFEKLNVLMLDRIMTDPASGKIIFTDKILPGSHVNFDEDINSAAKRVLFEFTGIDNIELHQFRTFGALDRLNRQDRDVLWLRTIGQDPYQRVVSIVFYSLVDANKYEWPIQHQKEHHQMYNPGWYPINDLPKEMAYDHHFILDEALAFLRDGVKYNPLVFELLPEKFSLGLMQKIYETILGRNFDKRNFRRKLLKMPFIVPLNEKQQSVLHKPAQLYYFDRKIYQQVRKNNYDLML
ncbi:MAG TPA: NUDIX domain-containing protein [Bacteroidales bacterium]